MTQIVLHLRTKNDVNGNPRRLYVPLDPDKNYNPAVYVIEEGYRGCTGLRGHVFGNTVMVPINVTITEYNEWVRHAKEEGNYIP